MRDISGQICHAGGVTKADRDLETGTLHPIESTIVDGMALQSLLSICCAGWIWILHQGL
jgi:hypothetical protein